MQPSRREERCTETYSPRTFIVGPDDTLFRLASANFSRMVDDPEHRRLERFAGQRVRMVDAIVEIRDRTPCAVVRLVYQMLGFDACGRLDRRAFMCQNVALADLVAGRVVGGSTTNEATIVEASSRFVARGGLWQPSPSLEQRILRAALGELKCERL
jgi:hypothetical protein